MNFVLTRVVLPLGILVAAGGTAFALVSLNREAERSPPDARPTVVDVVEVNAEDAVAQIEATGVVQPAQQVVLTPQVSGRIVWQSDKLVPGGRVDRGEVLARIDPTEYELLVEQAKSTVRQAEVELELERGRKSVAAREWALLGEGRSAEDAPLALREPQMRAAEQALTAARSSLQQAELNLQRTYLVAPFNAVIQNESIDRGQVVGPTSTVATLVGTDEVWVEVSVPVRQLPAISLPTDEQAGSPARVEQRLGSGSAIVRDGAVAQMLPTLNAQTRTAQLLVVVPNPLGADGELPLLPGAYVDVAIDGRVLEQVLRVPRIALDDGNKVWVVEREGILGSRSGHHRLARSRHRGRSPTAWSAGSRVVVSPLALPIEGMAGGRRSCAPTNRRRCRR